MSCDSPPCSVVNHLRLPVQRGVCAVQSLRLQPSSHPGSNSFRFSRVIRSQLRSLQILAAGSRLEALPAPTEQVPWRREDLGGIHRTVLPEKGSL
jgi:hypothetical protein